MNRLETRDKVSEALSRLERARAVLGCTAEAMPGKWALVNADVAWNYLCGAVTLLDAAFDLVDLVKDDLQKIENDLTAAL